MSIETHAADRSDASGYAEDSSGGEHCIIKRRDGVYVDPSVLGTTFQAAVNNIFFANTYFGGIDYTVFIKALYDCGPDLPRSKTGEALIRFAADIVPFNVDRRSLYKAVKITGGAAEYFFEPVYLPDPDNPEDSGAAAYLDFDEFVADMWVKGIRFGIDEAAVRAAMESTKTERVVVARRLDAAPGRDAVIVEVSEDIHRNDAPRQLANGKLDLMAFQNRFPQVRKNERLLRKVPREAGMLGFELSGMPLEPPIPKDIDLGRLAGLGTVIENTEDGEYLVTQQAGFLTVDRKTSQLSVDVKIVSREGVSSRTTGNLTLKGDYEEYGEVQEKRVIEGESITIHADVFGNIVSRGGIIRLNNNLVGGSATNALGDIHLRGIASGAVLQTVQGEITMTRAESCVISGTIVTIEHAANCEIIADEVNIKTAEGCAIAARRITIEQAGPRKQSEMLIYAFVPDSGKIDQAIADMTARVQDFDSLLTKRKAEMDALTNMPEVRKYLMLATKIRKKELTLTPEQVPQFQKMAVAVGPALKAIGKISLDVKSLDTEKQSGLAMIAQIQQQQSEAGGPTFVNVQQIVGDTQVRTMKFDPDEGNVYDLPAKDIKAKLRKSSAGRDTLFAGQRGQVEWDFENWTPPKR